MTASRLRNLAPWLAGVAAAAWLVTHAHYSTDLSAFLPAHPTSLQRQLVEQLRDGPASRLILIALEDGDARGRARISEAMAQRLRGDAGFSAVQNGDTAAAEHDRDFLLQHRYLLSSAVTARQFSAAGLRAAIAATLENLASSAGLLLAPLVPHDPTGELLHIIDDLSRVPGPASQDGVWASVDGRRTLLAARTTAAGSDIDAQERDVGAIRRAFLGAVAAAGPAAVAVRLRMSGPGVFAVAARATIKRAATRLSIASSVLVVALLWAVYRSSTALLLGVLPVATGALFGIAAVALGFGAVHGLTLGFGITLIGESLDYSIYFFIQSRRRETTAGAGAGAGAGTDTRTQTGPRIDTGTGTGADTNTGTQTGPGVDTGTGTGPGSDTGARTSVGTGTGAGASAHAGTRAGATAGTGNGTGFGGSWQRQLWPTVRLGMLTSVCGFASLLPSGFPGLAQLGLYSISGLLAAAWVTRFVLPELMPPHLQVRDVTPLGQWLGRCRDRVRVRGPLAVAGTACGLGAIALAVLVQHRDALWNRELSALSPVAPDDLRYDATLRSDLGAANVLDLVIVSGPSEEAALQGAERAGAALQSLMETGAIGGFESPADYLPSLAAQRSRRDALPDGAVLRDNLRLATANLDLKDGELAPFIEDVAAARRGPLLTPADLRGTSMAAGFDALMLRRPGHFSALLPLHAASVAAPPLAPGTAARDLEIDLARVRAALAAAEVPDAAVLDLPQQTAGLYSSYLHEAIRLSLFGFGAIVLLLLAALRSARRTVRVLAPLVLAVLTVAAALAASGRQLTILHLVGMLLTVAVGSNYALFFDGEGTRPADATSSLMLASLGIANLSTVIAFGLLSFSRVPVLEALGDTVAPGAFLALLFSALVTSRAPPAGARQVRCAA
jgi:predicted exporter